MKNTVILFSLAALFAVPLARAQYWVEFDPGTCLVGPPPVCVSGHWYWVEAPNLPSAGFQQMAIAQDAGSVSSSSADRASAYYRPTEFSTDLEYETFSRNGMEGKSIGLRALYEKVSATGFGWGGRGVYTSGTIEYQGFTDDTKTRNMSVNLYLIKYLNESIFVTGGYFLSSYKVKEDDPDFERDAMVTQGPFISVAFSTMAGPVSLGGGISYSGAKVKWEDFIDESAATLSWGFSSGYRINEYMNVTGEFFVLKEGVSVLGLYLFRAMSEAFGLTLGYKTLMGVEDFKNSKITLGSSIRF